MRLIIVDDELMARSSLERLCNKIEDVEICGIFQNGLEALGFLQNNQVDVVLLDIEMPDLTGIELVKSTKLQTQIIFTTSRVDFALESYEYEVTDFIGKPVKLPRLMQALEKARTRLREKEKASAPSPTLQDEIFVKSEGRLVRIALNDLLFVETVGDYVAFQTKTEKHVVHSTLKNIATKLEHPHFLKVHRSYIVNLKAIVDIEDGTLVIGKKVIPVSRAHRAELMNRIQTI